ncbi:MAG TPA: ABC transporter permease [Kofleriaceae bacterium]|nr:ABC transporter permease [Kofleriaceae bacterium]
MTGFLQDLRFALRLTIKDRTLSAIVILTIGLGIGAVTAIFGVVDAVLLAPLPYPHPDRLVRLYTATPAQHLDRFWLSAPEYFDLRRDARSYQSVAGYHVAAAALGADERPIRSPAAYTTASFAETIGVRPAIGRYFTPEEDLPGDIRALVISHRLWKGAFGGSQATVGRRVTVDGMTATIVGIMPADFAFPRADVDLWLPLELDPASTARDEHYVSGLGRLGSDTSLARARSELDALMTGWQAAGHGHALSRAAHPMEIHALKDEIVGPVRSTLWLLQGAVLLVMLIACANVANLLRARAEVRTREISIRTALGASRRRLVRQFLTESAFLGLLGSALGIGLAKWGIDGTVALLPAGAPRASEIGMSLPILGFALLVGLATSVLFGLTPILHARAAHLGADLKDGQRATTPGRQRFRRALVISEVSLAVVLVIGCGLMVRSFVNLHRVDPGFQPAGLVTGEVEMVWGVKDQPSAAEKLQFWLRLQDRLKGEPVLSAVTLMSERPMARDIGAHDAVFEGKPPPPGQTSRSIDYWQVVGDDFFSAMGVRLIRGRFLGPQDVAGSLPVVVVNETLARRLYPGDDPIGKRLRVAPEVSGGKWQTVVGVIADVKQQSLEAPTGTEVFLSLRQAEAITGDTPYNMDVIARGAAQPDAAMAVIQRVVTEVDPTVPVHQLRTLEDVLRETAGKSRFLTFLLAIFSGLALTLATIGIYGVMSYSVAQRTREFGIRMALGARPDLLRRRVMAEGLLLAGIGIGVGLAASFALSTVLKAYVAGALYGVSAVDPATFAGVAGVVLAVAALACLVPAHRATRVDPMIALRQD